MILICSISYISTEYYLKRKFILVSLTTKLKNESKYKIKNTTKTTLQNLLLFTGKRGFKHILFYTKDKLNPNNYIYEKENDTYYLIEPNHYYYIKDSKLYSFHGNVEIFYIKIK